MRDILSVTICGFLMVGLMIFYFNIGKGSGHAAGKGLDFTQWFGTITHVQQADQDAQLIGDKRRENDNKLSDARQSLQDKMDQQRSKMEADQDRIRSMQERNDAQRMRLQEQMERMRNR